MNIIESKTIRTTVVRRIEIDRETLLQLIKSNTGCKDIPSNAATYVYIPGGGDWSNTQLDIDDQTPVVITWSEITDSEL